MDIKDINLSRILIEGFDKKGDYESAGIQQDDLLYDFIQHVADYGDEDLSDMAIKIKEILDNSGARWRA